MSAKDNQVYSMAAGMGGIHASAEFPERVIYGYSKLLQMGETQINSLFQSEWLKDLETARKWFEDNKLDLKMIKSGLSMLFGLLDDPFQGFIKYLENCSSETPSSEILTKALECATLPVKELFSGSKTMDDIMEYLSDKNEERAEKRKEEKEEENERDEAEETGDEKDDSEPAEESNSKKPVEDPDNDDDGQDPKDSIDRSSEPEAIASTKEDVMDLYELSDQYRKFTAALLDVVKGQDQAVLKFAQGYYQSLLLRQSKNNNRPRAYFFFFGPPGVGKTLLAETAAEEMGIPYRKFNMSEFAGHQAHEELLGSDSMYQNSHEGLLPKFVRKNPECLLIFDEIEKAHINVIRQFLQILGSGILHDKNKDKDVSFRDATIIFTSNVGKELYEDRSVNLTTLPEKVIISAIEQEKNANGEPAMPPEICSRIASGNPVMFNHLSIRFLVEIVKSNFDKVVMGMEEERNITVSYADNLPLLFLYNLGGDIDARVANEQSGMFIKDEIMELLRQLENRREGSSKISNIRLEMDWDNLSSDLKQLFTDSGRSKILIFADDKEGLSEKITSDHIEAYVAGSIEEAEKYLKMDIDAVFIDPFFGNEGDNETILSIADYNTDGIRLFHEIAESNSCIPMYMLERNGAFSNIDRSTFLQEGASAIVPMNDGLMDGFKRSIEEIMEEFYMEKQNAEFCQRGWMLDYKTKQQLNSDGKITILFYDIKKRMAIDTENRGSILSEAERPNISFDDVIGAENAKDELKYYVKYLKNPKSFLLNGSKLPKGVLLYGPPGTGKTMLAKAMAGESDVTFIQTSAAEFFNKYVGGGEENIKNLFKRAKKYAPAIIFIDEIDAIGKQRTGQDPHSETLLNVLLKEMDGFASENDSRKPVFVLAATNFGVGEESDGISKLDSALIRRFDNKVYVDLPNEAEREEYIIRMLKKKKIDAVTPETIHSIAERTTGQSLAILQNVIDLAFRTAVKANRKANDADMLTALEDYLHGEKKEHSPEYYRSVAHHEVGHAYISYLGGDKPSYITIESRGNYGGYMRHANSEDKTDYTREELIWKIRTALAGRAAEEVFYGREKSLNTGASSDLENATHLAFLIVSSLGMEENSLIVLSKEEILKSNLAADYVEKVNRILVEEMKNTVSLIEKGRDKIEKIADILTRENRMTGKQFDELMQED